MIRWEVREDHLTVIRHWVETEPKEKIDATIRVLNDIVQRALRPSQPLVTLK